MFCPNKWLCQRINVASLDQGSAESTICQIQAQSIQHLVQPDILCPHYHKIQEMYVGNLHKLSGVRERCVKYDMVDPLKFPTMIDVATTNPSFWWGGETTKRDMLVHWSQINMAETIAFQHDTSSFASEQDMTSSDWVKDLLANSSEADLMQQVDEKFEKFDPLEQGGITYLNFLLE